MEQHTSVRNPRPYWHVDAKWIVGLLLVAVLSGGLLVYGLYQVTERGPATRMIASGIGVYIGSMLPAEARTALRLVEAETLRRAAQSPNDQFQLLPLFNLTARGSEISHFTPEALEAYTSQRVAEAIYDKGAGGLAGILVGQSTSPVDIGLLSALGPETHQALGRYAAVLGVVALILLVPLLFFSAGFGRLGSPGVALTVAALPGTLAAAVLATMPGASSGAAGAADLAGIVAVVAGRVIPLAAHTVLPVYGQALVTGLGLVVMAVVFDWAWRLARRVRRRPGQAPGPGPG